MDQKVEIVEFPHTRVAAVEYRGSERRAMSATHQLIAWRRANGVGPEDGMTLEVQRSDPGQYSPYDFRLDICVSYDGEIGDNHYGVVAKTIPANRCARIRHSGSRHNMPPADYLYHIWLPTSGEHLGDFPMFFHYLNVGPGVEPPDMETDIYLPLA